MQCILSALVAIIIALAPVFNIPLTVVPPKGELPHESEPAPSELSIYDKVVGVDDSVFYISRPNAENMKIIYASDFGMDSNSQDNTDAFCRAIDYCRRNPGTRLVIDAGEYSFSPQNTIGLNSLKNVLIDAEDAVFVFDCENYILRADNVSGLNITNNKIINTRSIDGIDLRCGRIRLGDCCSAVKISGNRWNKTPLAPFGDIIALDHGLKAFL